MANHHTILMVFLFIHLSRNLAISQDVTRFLNDRFPNPNNRSCPSSACTEAGGYKECTDCCECHCNYGSYVTSIRSCAADRSIASGCKYVLGSRSYQYDIIPTSPELLQSGQKVSYCKTDWDVCESVAMQCEIERSKTVYDNLEWKRLWPLNADVDFEMKRKSATSDHLTWNAKDCNMNKYNGILVSLSLNCKVNGVSSRVSSCLVVKIAGTFRIGSNPLTRNNCTTTTTAPITKATEELTTSSSKTQPTTEQSSTGTYSTRSTTTLTTTFTTTQEVTPRVISSSNPSSSSKVTSFPVTIAKNTTRTKEPNIVKAEHEGGSNSKKDIITAASLSSVAFLLLVVLVLAAVYVMKRRRRPSSRQLEQKRESQPDMPQPYSAQSSSVIPMDAENDHSKSFWAVDENGEYDVVYSSPIFTVRVPGANDSPEGDLYDEPISRKASSLGKLYAIVNKRKQSSKKEVDDGYSSIKDLPLPPDTRRRGAYVNSQFSNDNADAATTGIILLQQPPLPTERQLHATDNAMDSAEVIYDEPDAIAANSGNAESNVEDEDGPVYMLYEPFHDVRAIGK